MTARDIQLALWYHLFPKYSGGMVVPNVYMDGWFEADILGYSKSDTTWEIEIKTSVADYRKDAEKTVDHARYGHGANGYLAGMRKHDLLATGCDKGPNRFSFALPSAVIAKIGLDNIPSFAGVLEVRTGSGNRNWIVPVRKAKTLHRGKPTDGTKKRVMCAAYYRYWKLLEKSKPEARYRDDMALFLSILENEMVELRDTGMSDVADRLLKTTEKIKCVYDALNYETHEMDGGDGADDCDGLCDHRSPETAGNAPLLHGGGRELF